MSLYVHDNVTLTPLQKLCRIGDVFGESKYSFFPIVHNPVTIDYSQVTSLIKSNKSIAIGLSLEKPDLGIGGIEALEIQIESDIKGYLVYGTQLEDLMKIELLNICHRLGCFNG